MNFESPTSLVQKIMTNKRFRDAFVYEQVKTGIPYQLRAIRKERRWKQGDMGEAVGKPRNVINRLENPNYGKLTLKTLFEIASGCDVALLVKFVPFSRLLKEYEDVSLEALAASSVADKDEVKRLYLWARRKIASEAAFEAQEPVTNTASFAQIPLIAGFQSEQTLTQTRVSDSLPDATQRGQRKESNIIQFRRRRNGRGRITTKRAA